jgi:hypothetical protein
MSPGADPGAKRLLAAFRVFLSRYFFFISRVIVLRKHKPELRWLMEPETGVRLAILRFHQEGFGTR